MAKICMVALVLAALVATSFAADAAFQRTLQQAPAKKTYTCGQAQRLAGPAITVKTPAATGCDDMLACLRKNAGALVDERNLGIFKRSCALCAAATKTCTTPAALAGNVPSACRAGLSITPVTKCVDELLVLAARTPAAPAKTAAAPPKKAAPAKVAPAKTAPMPAGH